MSETIRIVSYQPSLQSDWDDLVKRSSNGTFLFQRAFLAYHADRFEECSFIVYRKNSPEAVLPGALSGTVFSTHPGLTYGGFVVSGKMRFQDLRTAWLLIHENLKEKGVQTIVYKPVPLIYHRIPFQDDIYLLYRFHARKTACGLSSTIYRSNPLAFSKSRMFGVNRCKALGLQVEQSDRFDTFWPILERNLVESHGVRPVHTLEEIVYLHERFPENIHLFLAVAEGCIQAGTVLFQTEKVLHVQYMSASEAGKKTGALDGLFKELITNTFHKIPTIDFGVSTEAGGDILNEGLLFQKEGFGARGTVYETYEYQLDDAINVLSSASFGG